MNCMYEFDGPHWRHFCLVSQLWGIRNGSPTGHLPRSLPRSLPWPFINGVSMGMLESYRTPTRADTIVFLIKCLDKTSIQTRHQILLNYNAGRRTYIMIQWIESLLFRSTMKNKKKKKKNYYIIGARQLTDWRSTRPCASTISACDNCCWWLWNSPMQVLCEYEANTSTAYLL